MGRTLADGMSVTPWLESERLDLENERPMGDHQGVSNWARFGLCVQDGRHAHHLVR